MCLFTPQVGAFGLEMHWPTPPCLSCCCTCGRQCGQRTLYHHMARQQAAHRHTAHANPHWSKPKVHKAVHVYGLQMLRRRISNLCSTVGACHVRYGRFLVPLNFSHIAKLVHHHTPLAHPGIYRDLATSVCRPFMFTAELGIAHRCERHAPAPATCLV